MIRYPAAKPLKSETIHSTPKCRGNQLKEPDPTLTRAWVIDDPRHQVPAEVSPDPCESKPNHAQERSRGQTPKHAPCVSHHLLQKRITPELSRSEEHTSEIQSLMRISYAVFCLQ